MTELTDEQVLKIWNETYVQRGETGLDFARAVIAADRALQNDAWRKAIDAARIALMLDITAPDANPAECVKELVSWANELALNPAISSDAQALIDRGLAMQAERHREELLAYEVTVGNLRAACDEFNETFELLAQQDWPVMPPSIGQSPVLFEDGYAEGWAKCLDACKAMLSAAQQTQPDQPLKERPDFIAGYMAGMADGKAMQAQPERKPMTESEMLEGRERTFSVDNPYCPCDRKTFMKVARYVEAFHGIFGGKP